MILMKLTTSLAALVLAAAPAAFGQASAKGSDSPDVQTITQIEHDWGTALLKADVAAEDRITAPEWMFSDSEGTLGTRTQADSELASGLYKVASFKIDDLKVRVYGDTAIAFGIETETSSYRGADSSGQYRYTDVYVKRDGTWVAVATHASKVKT